MFWYILVFSNVREIRKMNLCKVEECIFEHEKPESFQALKWAVDPRCKWFTAHECDYFSLSTKFGLGNLAPPLAKSRILPESLCALSVFFFSKFIQPNSFNLVTAWVYHLDFNIFPNSRCYMHQRLKVATFSSGTNFFPFLHNLNLNWAYVILIYLILIKPLVL